MSTKVRSTTLLSALLLMAFEPAPLSAKHPAAGAKQIAQYSYRLGNLAAFAEMVGVGVKKLALGTPMLPTEMDAFMRDAQRVAKEQRVQIYCEPDLLVTDLFPASITAGKQVLLIYKGSTLDEYLALKQRKAALVQAGAYSGKAREEIAREFGKLLSYPDATLDRMLGDKAPKEE